MFLLKRVTLIAVLATATSVHAVGRVRDVNTQRNQVTVMMTKAGEFAMGGTVYFFRSGRSSGSAQITQAFHTKAIARITTGAPQIGDDASATNKAPKAGPKVHTVSFAAMNVQAHEFEVAVEFENQEKQQRKLVLNSEVAVQIQGAQGYMSLTAALLKSLEITWENGALKVTRATLSDKSHFDLTRFVAADLFAKFKPAAETRGQTVKGKITFIKKIRDLKTLADGISINISVAGQSQRVKPGLVYKLKVYCNELFASEVVIRPNGQDISESLMLNPVDLAPGDNNLEVRLVEVTGMSDLLLDTDNDQMVGTLSVNDVGMDKNAKVSVKLPSGLDAFVHQLR